MFTQPRPLSPIDYAINHGLTHTKLAREIGISENAVSRYFFSDTAKSKSRPDSRTLRIIQLLDFIKQNGLTPPDPNF